MQLQGISVAELTTNFTAGAITASVNFVGGAIDGGLKLSFGVQGVTISNIKYTVQGSPVVMADSARTIRDNYTASDTLWSRTVVAGNLVLAPNNSTAACTLSRKFSGLVVGRTYRLLIAVPNSGAPTTGTFANIIAEGSTTPMFTIEANLAWQTITTSNSNTNAPRSGYSQVNGTGIKEYYLIFKATTSAITINYLGAKTNANLGGRSLRHIKLIQEPVFEGYSETMDLASGYRYGFNTQQKQDDIYGPGNHNTALYWEYDTRLGRRWNLDPIFNTDISRYAVNGNNPIYFLDPLGNYKTKFGALFANLLYGGEGVAKSKSGKGGEKGDWYYYKKEENEGKGSSNEEGKLPTTLVSYKQHFGYGSTAANIGWAGYDFSVYVYGLHVSAYKFARKHASDYINLPMNRAKIADFYTFSLNFQNSTGIYMNEELTFTLTLRGQDPGLYLNTATGIGAVSSVGVDVGCSVGAGYYIGGALKDFDSRKTIAGDQINGSVGIGLKAIAGGNVNGGIDLGFDDNGKPSTVSAKAGVSIGVGVSTPVVTIGGGVGRGFKAVRIFKF